MPSRHFRWLFYSAALLTLSLAAVLMWIDQYLASVVSPQGIISLEMARTPDTARAILDAWGEQGTHWAYRSVWLDFPFLAGYVTLFICLTVLTHAGARNLVIGGFALAGCADLIENLLLLQMLAGNLTATVTHATYWCASVKFGVLVVGWIYLLFYGLYELYRHLRPNPPGKG